MGIEINDLTKRLRAGERRALAQAITLIESSLPEHRALADQLLQLLISHTGKSQRIGITGTPGVGKSTFIEALGSLALKANHKIAVLAIDPSSTITGGSILGDKTRMPNLAQDPRVFIRPTPAGKTLGGVERHSRDTLLLCEAAGYDLILVETLGVGQAETNVAQLTDMFILLLAPGGGDELQGIKRGIVELADLVLINKADSDLKNAAQRTAAEYSNALSLLSPRDPKNPTQLLSCSALTHDNIDKVWTQIQTYFTNITASGRLEKNRSNQALHWLNEEINQQLISSVTNSNDTQQLVAKMQKSVMQNKTPCSVAASKILQAFFNTSKGA